jgi:hypothetical protein
VPVEGPTNRRRLCHRCGAVLEHPETGTSGTSSCPECGLSYSWKRLSVASNEGAQTSRSVDFYQAHREARDQIASQWPGPLFGLDARWNGSRWISGIGRSGGTLTDVELGHGNPFVQSSPLVQIRTRLLLPPNPWPGRGHEAKRLAQMLWRDGASHELVRPTLSDSDPLRTWDEVRIDVSEAPVAFRILSADAAWVAVGETDGAAISVHARLTMAEATRLERVSANSYAHTLPEPPRH